MTSSAITLKCVKCGEAWEPPVLGCPKCFPPAPPPAILGDEERARIQSNSLGRGVDTMWADVYRQGALWGLRTSRAELLAEREKVRRLEEELEALKPGPRGRPKTIDRHQVKALFDHGLCTREIAKELGVSQSGVEKVLVEIREALKETE